MAYNWVVILTHRNKSWHDPLSILSTPHPPPFPMSPCPAKRPADHFPSIAPAIPEICVSGWKKTTKKLPSLNWQLALENKRPTTIFFFKWLEKIRQKSCPLNGGEFHGEFNADRIRKESPKLNKQNTNRCLPFKKNINIYILLIYLFSFSLYNKRIL